MVNCLDASHRHKGPPRRFDKIPARFHASGPRKQRELVGGPFNGIRTWVVREDRGGGGIGHKDDMIKIRMLARIGGVTTCLNRHRQGMCRIGQQQKRQDDGPKCFVNHVVDSKSANDTPRRECCFSMITGCDWAASLRGKSDFGPYFVTPWIVKLSNIFPRSLHLPTLADLAQCR